LQRFNRPAQRLQLLHVPRMLLILLLLLLLLLMGHMSWILNRRKLVQRSRKRQPLWSHLPLLLALMRMELQPLQLHPQPPAQLLVLLLPSVLASAVLATWWRKSRSRQPLHASSPLLRQALSLQLQRLGLSQRLSTVLGMQQVRLAVRHPALPLHQLPLLQQLLLLLQQLQVVSLLPHPQPLHRRSCLVE
jgi:hypothetical protein